MQNAPIVAAMRDIPAVFEQLRPNDFDGRKRIDRRGLTLRLTELGHSFDAAKAALDRAEQEGLVSRFGNQVTETPALWQLTGRAFEKGTQDQMAMAAADAEPLKAPPLEVFMDRAQQQILAVARDSSKTVDQRMRAIIALDKAWAGKDSPTWAKALETTEQAVRKADTWKTIQASRNKE